MESLAKRAGLWLIAVAMFLSSSISVLMSSDVFAVDVKSLNYKKTAGIKDCPIMQGGTSDGSYAYFVCYKSDAYKKAVIVKVGIADGKESMRKSIKASDIGHANGMAYNDKLKQLIITRWKPDGTNEGKLTFVSADTLEVVSKKNVSTKAPWTNLCYSSTKDQYVANGRVFDSNFQYEKKIYDEADVDKAAGSGTGQGMACDESYVYAMRGGLGDGVDAVTGKFKIITYDWSGEIKATYSIFVDKYTENENIFVANGKLYVGLNIVKGGSIGEQFGVIEGALSGQGETGSGSAHPLTIGSYNLHGTLIDSEFGCKAKARFETAAKNIISSGMDIVGMQEYSDYDDSKSPDCNGEQVKLLDILNATAGGVWRATVKPAEADGGGYQETQASILYNSAVTSLVSDDAKNIAGGAIKDDSWPSANCQGGSPIFHVAGFSDFNGTTFYVANGHWCTADGSQRDKDTQSLMKIMSDYTGSKLIIGDTNSQIGQEVEKVMANNNYGDAHLTAAEKNAANYGTMAGDGKGNNIIDRIYYEKSTVSDPSTYTTSNCKKAMTCGSDHRPISAVLPSILVGANSAECGGDQKDVFDSDISHYDVMPCVCSQATSGDSTIDGDTTAEKLFTFLISTKISTNGDAPLSAAQAAGAVGNIMRESGGDTYDLRPDAVNGIGASGIVQWLGDRKTNLKKFAEKQGTEWSDFTTQLKFIIYELENSEKAIIKDSEFKSVTNDEAGARAAAARWDTVYERSGGAGVSGRQDNAAKVFNDFGGNAPGTTTSTAASGDCGSNESSLSIDGLPDGGVKDNEEGRKIAIALLQQFINDMNTIRGSKFPDVPTNLQYGTKGSGTPGTKAGGGPCFAGANNCDQCYALSAWFMQKYTTKTISSKNGTANGISISGVKSGSEPKVYSVFSYGPPGSSSSHTGVIIGIDGDTAITIENNMPRGQVFMMKRKADANYFASYTFGKKASVKTTFHYVAEFFRDKPKEFK